MAVPRITSWTSDGTRPARSIAARTTSAPSRGAGTSRSAFPYFPIGVRTALAKTTSAMASGRGRDDAIKRLCRRSSPGGRAALLERRGLVDLEILRLDGVDGAIGAEANAVPSHESRAGRLEVRLLALDRLRGQLALPLPASNLNLLGFDRGHFRGSHQTDVHILGLDGSADLELPAAREGLGLHAPANLDGAGEAHVLSVEDRAANPRAPGHRHLLSPHVTADVRLPGNMELLHGDILRDVHPAGRVELLARAAALDHARAGDVGLVRDQIPGHPAAAGALELLEALAADHGAGTADHARASTLLDPGTELAHRLPDAGVDLLHPPLRLFLVCERRFEAGGDLLHRALNRPLDHRPDVSVPDLHLDTGGMAGMSGMAQRVRCRGWSRGLRGHRGLDPGGNGRDAGQLLNGREGLRLPALRRRLDPALDVQVRLLADLPSGEPLLEPIQQFFLPHHDHQRLGPIE